MRLLLPRASRKSWGDVETVLQHPAQDTAALPPEPFVPARRTSRAPRRTVVGLVVVAVLGSSCVVAAAAVDVPGATGLDVARDASPVEAPRRRFT